MYQLYSEILVIDFYFLIFLFLSFIFWPYHDACGILIPIQGSDPVPRALGARSFNLWTARKDHTLFFDPLQVLPTVSTLQLSTRIENTMRCTEKSKFRSSRKCFSYRLVIRLYLFCPFSSFLSDLLLYI